MPLPLPLEISADPLVTSLRPQRIPSSFAQNCELTTASCWRSWLGCGGYVPCIICEKEIIMPKMSYGKTRKTECVREVRTEL